MANTTKTLVSILKKLFPVEGKALLYGHAVEYHKVNAIMNGLAEARPGDSVII